MSLCRSSLDGSFGVYLRAMFASVLIFRRCFFLKDLQRRSRSPTDTFGLLEGVDAREITNQHEQYDATVHLFIGTRRSPGKSTFKSLTFTYDCNINH
jgi:hypothetical protein